MRTITDTNEFRTLAKNEVAKIEKDTYGREISHEEIQVVFMSYVMGFMKATLVVAKNTKGRYYEISYSPGTKYMYIDEYTKSGSKVVNLDK